MSSAVPESSTPSEAHQSPVVAFDDLVLPDRVRRGIAGAGFTHTTPIQGKVLPFSLAGRDVAGQAQTGTGKTAAFLITIATRLLEHEGTRRPAAPRALVIAPTRELAVQIANDAELLGFSEMGLIVQAVYGGVDYKKQRESLGRDVDLLVGTPGRLIDYWKQRVYDLRAVEMLVIDEADRMFDMGFIKDLRFLLRRCPPVDERQSMMFSATLSHDVMELAYMFMNEAVRVEVKPEQVTAEGVEHHLYHVGKHEKVPFLFGLLKGEGVTRTLIFVNMRRTADQLCRTFAMNGIAAEQITGDIEQRKRLKILEDFKDGSLPILIATDVASRGLHIEGVTHVINYDLPLDAEDYVHRVGRTARAGATGKAISLACEDYVEGLEPIEKLIGFKIPHEFPDDSMMTDVKTAPRLSRRRFDAGEGPGRRRSERGPGPAPRGRSSDSHRTAERARPESGAEPSARHRTAEAMGPSEGAIDVAGGTEGQPAKRRRRRRKRAGSGAASGDAPASSAAAEGSEPRAARDGDAAAAEGAPRRKRRRRRRRPGEAAGGDAASRPAAAHAGSDD